MENILDPPAAEPATEAQTEVVLPRTLGIRPLKMGDVTVHGVYGGVAGEIWCATFFDEQEAQAWIIGSNSFGQALKGIISQDVMNAPKIIQ